MCHPLNLNSQIHSHRVEVYHTNQGYEASRREQAWLQAERQNRERAQGARLKITQEVYELRRICSSELERTQEIRTDELCRPEFRESHSTVNQLTVQIQGTARRSDQEFPRILKRQAVLDHSNFLVILWIVPSSFGKALHRFWPAA